MNHNKESGDFLSRIEKISNQIKLQQDERAKLIVSIESGKLPDYAEKNKTEELARLVRSIAVDCRERNILTTNYEARLMTNLQTRLDEIEDAIHRLDQEHHYLCADGEKQDGKRVLLKEKQHSLAHKLRDAYQEELNYLETKQKGMEF